jgi:hypothetical protein
MLSREYKKILIMGAKGGYLPSNCVCPVACKFCYEKYFTKTFPSVETRYIPGYTDESFDYFYNKFLFYQSDKKRNTNTVSFQQNIQKQRCRIQFLPTADFFSLGLSQRQIVKIIQVQDVFYTTGFNVDSKFIEYLTQKYPGKFRLHLSIVTFDSNIRKQIMNQDIDIDNLKKICEVAIKPTYFLLCFNKKQIVSDINILNKLSLKNKGDFYIHKLYSTKFSPDIIKNYAIKGENDFQSVVYYLKFNDVKLGAISKRLSFSPSSSLYAWRFREEIKKLLKVCKGLSSEAIFCSPGAFEVVSGFKNKANVVPVENSMGGNIDFAQGITIRAIICRIRQLIAKGSILKDIYIPSSMFVFRSKFDLNGDTVNLIKQELPEIRVKVINIPLWVTKSVLTLDTCFKYYILKGI